MKIKLKKNGKVKLKLFEKTTVQNMKPFVWYFAPSCLLKMRRKDKRQYKPGEMIEVEWENHYGCNGEMKIIPDYPVIRYSKNIWRKYFHNAELQKKAKKEVIEVKERESRNGHREKIKLKIRSKKKLVLKRR